MPCSAENAATSSRASVASAEMDLSFKTAYQWTSCSFFASGLRCDLRVRLLTSRSRKNPSQESQQPFFHFTAQKKSSKTNGLAHNQYCSKITPRNAMRMLPAAATRKTSFLLSIVPPMVPNSGNDTPHRSSQQKR